MTTARPTTDHKEGVVIASEHMAQRIWPGEEALGKRVSLEGNEGPWYKVVGVARHVRHRSLLENTDGEASDSDLYFALSQAPVLRLDVAVRTTVAPETVMASVCRQFREIDPSVPVFNMASFDELIGAEIALTRFASMQLGSYGLIALLLASVGLYGVISHTVARRTKEIGIRVALGASPRSVVTLMLRQGVWMIAAGAALGLLGAYAGTRVMASQLYGVTTTDLPTYLGVTVVLSAVGLLACLVPARRAIRVDPRKALTGD
ncbi:MAG: FtsX-like permease family protein [Gemmatimonadetes bacterium]|nr:FtsX-like permease family protein [Gemmatimonadota bacterium]